MENGIVRLLTLLMVIALTCSNASADGSAQSPASADRSIGVHAHIDGRDHLILIGQTAQWHHFDFAAVGRHAGRNLPTFIGGLPGSPYPVFEWIPEWPLPPPNQIRFEALSSIFNGLAPSVPSDGVAWRIEKTLGRGTVRIVEQPTVTNSFALIVEFDDNAYGGSTDYEIVISPAFDSAGQIDIDVKPLATGNGVNLKLNNVRVSISGNSTFDALQVDPASARFGPTVARARRHEVKDYGGDGYMDLGLIFRIRDVGFACGDQQVTLTATTYAGEAVAGTDAVHAWKCRK